MRGYIHTELFPYIFVHRRQCPKFNSVQDICVVTLRVPVVCL